LVDKENVREMKQTWGKGTKEGIDSSSSELEHCEWPYQLELE
jgi:hypothetical protein